MVLFFDLCFRETMKVHCEKDDKTIVMNNKEKKTKAATAAIPVSYFPSGSNMSRMLTM